MTDLLFLRDASIRTLATVVTAVDGRRIALASTVCYPTGGGQPHDTGSVRWTDQSGSIHQSAIASVRKEGADVWHELDGDVPTVGQAVDLEIDWERRHQLMRTHTAMHILCGVIWNEYGVAVTGGNMEPLKGRMDFEFDPLPDGFADHIGALVQAEIDADRPIEVSFLERGVALADAELIRTKVNLIPESVTEIRVVDIVGLDKQADGGTHVPSTAQVGRFTVTKTESKGKGNKRIRFELGDR